MDFKNFLVHFNESFTFFVIFPLIVLLGSYLTLKLRFLQISKLKMSFSQLLKKGNPDEGSITHYEAISAVLGGNFGTGNISGMAIALTTGGPGALVWMWVIAFLGAMIQYASCVLGVKYRRKNEQGEYVGGPMYYLSEGLGFKKLGVLFSVFALMAALTVGNLAQVNSISLPLEKIGIDPLISGLGMALISAVVILGGMHRFAKVASAVVPLMAVLYFGAALFIICSHYTHVIPAFWIMLKSAISPSALVGGTLGYGVIKAITSGFERGIFATDAGTGIAPILQASAKTKHPVVDGIVTLVAPFLVMIVCTATGLVLILTGAWQQTGLYSTNMVTHAFQQTLGNGLGSFIVITALLLFSYTTILAWSCCADKAVNYLWGTRYIRRFQYFYIAVIPVGALVHVDIVWLIADLSISFMLITNMIGISGLSQDVISTSRAYFNPALVESDKPKTSKKLQISAD